MVADRHSGDDLLTVEEDRQRAFDRHDGLDRLCGLVDSPHPLGQAWVVRVRTNEIIVIAHGRSLKEIAPPSERLCALTTIQTKSPAEPPGFLSAVPHARRAMRAQWRPPKIQISKMIGSGIPISQSSK